jgi:hypothetical protein
VTSLFDYKIISIVLWVLLGGLFSSCAEGQDRSVLTYTSPNPQDLSHFGVAITDIEDINNDGVSDFLVGASWENVGETTNAGRAYLLRNYLKTRFQRVQSRF